MTEQTPPSRTQAPRISAKTPDILHWNDTSPPGVLSAMRSAWDHIADTTPPKWLRSAYSQFMHGAVLTRPLHVSAYVNFYQSQRGTGLLFHGVSGAIDEVPLGYAHVLERLRETNRTLAPGELPGAAAAALLARGHLTLRGPTSEQRSFRQRTARLHALENAAASPYLTLIPSYRCNLRCPYCFQRSLRGPDKKPAAIMSGKYVDMLLEKTLPDAFGELGDDFHIQMLGGEPLLPSHLNVLARVLHHASHGRFTVSAITNGTLIERCADSFGPAKGQVNSVQISLDGPPDLHNRSRVPVSGSNTFELILNNAIRLARQGVKVAVRVNVTRESVEGLPRLAEILLSKRIDQEENVSCYCSPVTDAGNPLCGSSTPELSVWDLHSRMEEAGVTNILDSPALEVTKDAEHLFLQAGFVQLHKTSYCMFSAPGSVVVDSLGDVYGCLEEAGNQTRRVGVVSSSGELQLNRRNATYLSRNVAACDPCTGCSIALACGGGCAINAERAHGTMFAQDCGATQELIGPAIVAAHGRRISNGKPYAPPEYHPRR